MFSERGFIRPDIEMLGRLIQERDSIVVGKRGRQRPTLFCFKRGERGRAWRRCRCVFPRSAMHSAKDVLSVDETVSTVLDTCVLECTCYKIIKPLVDDHPSFTTTPIWFWGARWSEKKGSAVERQPKGKPVDGTTSKRLILRLRSPGSGTDLTWSKF